jgi:hypothetical protein
MKKLLLISILLISYTASKAQTINCSAMCVLNIAIDTANDELDVTIYNGDTNHVNYPTVVVVDALGDTVGNINNQFYLFAHMPGDTVTHVIPTTLTSLPPGFTGTVYFTDQVWDTTCSYSYPMNCTVSVPEFAASGSVSVYPNPATDNITIDLNKLNNQNSVISIYDVTGKIVRSYSVAENQLHINRDGLQSGLYFITVVAENRRYTSKLVIK